VRFSRKKDVRLLRTHDVLGPSRCVRAFAFATFLFIYIYIYIVRCIVEEANVGFTPYHVSRYRHKYCADNFVKTRLTCVAHNIFVIVNAVLFQNIIQTVF
jgi:hypothetical protein